MIQVSIPSSIPIKEFEYNAEVDIINPVADTVLKNMQENKNPKKL